VSTTNIFAGLEEMLDINVNIRVKKTVKPPPILVDRVNNLSYLKCSKDITID
jgi:hypothetical protein